MIDPFYLLMPFVIVMIGSPVVAGSAEVINGDSTRPALSAPSNTPAKRGWPRSTVENSNGASTGASTRAASENRRAGPASALKRFDG